VKVQLLIERFGKENQRNMEMLDEVKAEIEKLKTEIQESR
jgi:hypothetical protein